MDDYENMRGDNRAPVHIRIRPDLKRRMDEVVPRGERDNLFDCLLEDLLPLLEGEKGPAILSAIYERRLRARHILREATQHGNAGRSEAKLSRTLPRE